jgi:repressor LexA
MENDTRFGKIMRALREKHAESQTELGHILDVSPQMISKFETGKSVPSATTLKTLSRHFGVTIEELLGIAEDADYFENSQLMKHLPVLGKISAGKPLFAIEQQIGSYPILPGVDGDFLLLVTGDSMEPIIPNQAYVVVKQGVTVSSGGIAVVMVDDAQAVVKRTYFDPNGVILKSENRLYPPVFIDKERWETMCRLIGKVTTVINRLEESRDSH